jgi:hypothetical protein
MTSHSRGDMRLITFAAILMLTVPAMVWGLPPAGTETIGVVKNSGGTATVTRGDQVLKAAPGTKLLAGDTLSTGPDGTLGIILRDNSVLSLGPGSRLAVQQFLFSPADGKMGMLTRVSKGTMAYISGLLGKLAPESVRFETPVASIGIRGTCFAVKVEEPAS